MKAFCLRVAAVTFLMVVVSACFIGNVRADEAALKAAETAAAAGDYATAVTKMREYIASNPGDSDVYAALQSWEDKVVLRTLAQGGESEQLMKWLLDRARPVAERATMSDDEIASTARAAVESSDISDRRRAAARLRVAGDLAVPHLYKYLGEEDDGKLVAAMLALRGLGSAAVAPLAEVATHSESASERGYAAAVLGEIGDPSGGAAVLSLSGDEDPAVQSRAARAAEKLGASGAAADAYVALGNRYYNKDLGLRRDFTTSRNMWRWMDGSLARMTVPFYLYGYQMAEECAADALESDSGSSAAGALLVRSILAQKIEADLRGDDAPASLKGSFALAQSLGFAAASDALRASLDGKDWDVASECCALCTATYGSENLAGHPLGDALVAPNKHLRYSAAIAALHMSPKSALPNSDKVAALAAQAASESAIRQVLVIDNNPETQGQLRVALEHGGYMSSAEELGTEGVARAKGSPTMDVIIVRSDLGDQANTIPANRHLSSLMVIDELIRDPRTTDMSIVVLLQATPEQQVGPIENFLKDKYGDKVKGFIKVPLVEADALSVIAAAAEAKDLNPDRERANALAARAAGAFAAMDFSCRTFMLDVAVEPLSTAATEGPTPEIRLNAVKALGNIRTGGADALVQALTDGEGDDLKQAAATALGSVLSATDGTPEQIEALMSAADGEGDVATAALTALGQVRNLTAEQRLQIFAKHRLQVASGN
jgi:HEAT repeat protein